VSVWLSAGALVTLSSWFGWAWWQRTAATISTDNAYVQGDITIIGPKISGYVAEVLVGDNQIVNKGDVLLRIADEDYRAKRSEAAAAVAQAEAGIEHLKRRKELQHVLIREAEAAVKMARADVILSERQLTRATRLVNTGATSGLSHDSATADAERARAALIQNEAAVMAARQQLAVLDSETDQVAARLVGAHAYLQLAEISLSETVIRAPVAGVVGNRRVRSGEYVRPGSNLLSIVPINSVWVVANFKETQVAGMELGQKVDIAVDGYPDISIEGKVDSLSPASGAAFSLLPPDNASGNFVKIVQRVPVKIKLRPNHALLGRLIPGMSVNVTVDTQTFAAESEQARSDTLTLGSPLFRIAR
jgi:membrane fusion protein (multidrug efflux system)